MRKMNWIIKFKALLVSLSLMIVCSENYHDEIKEDGNLINCVTSDQNLGFCVDIKECNSSDTSNEVLDPNNCPIDGSVCCDRDNIARFTQIWSSIQNIWSAWPTLPARPTAWPSYTRPSWTTSTSPSPSISTTLVNTTVACGHRNLSKDIGYIVGGIEAPAHSWPWAVAVYIGSGPNLANYRFVCGASVIAPQYVLGAAHCVSKNNKIVKPENIGLLIGAHDRRYEGKHYTVDKVLVHSKYDERLMQNDIALYRLSEPIDFTTTEDIAPVCLPSPDIDSHDLSKHVAYLVGWGTTSAGGKTSDFLRQVQVPIITNRECAQRYNSLMITSRQLCAGYPFGQRDSCQGDSGGPMTIKVNDKDKGKTPIYMQIGIVSWGKGCAEAKFPGVYTKVSSYLDWIYSNLQD